MFECQYIKFILSTDQMGSKSSNISTHSADTLTQPVDTLTQPVDTLTQPVDTLTQPVDTLTQPAIIMETDQQTTNSDYDMISMDLIGATEKYNDILKKYSIPGTRKDNNSNKSFGKSYGKYKKRNEFIDELPESDKTFIRSYEGYQDYLQQEREKIDESIVYTVDIIKTLDKEIAKEQYCAAVKKYNIFSIISGLIDPDEDFPSTPYELALMLYNKELKSRDKILAKLPKAIRTFVTSYEEYYKILKDEKKRMELERVTIRPGNHYLQFSQTGDQVKIVESQSNYRVIAINPQLEQKNFRYRYVIDYKQLSKKKLQYGVHHLIANNNKHTEMNSKIGFVNAFLNAYNNHHDVYIAPADIWLVITITLADYIEKNSESVRDLFVTHEGKKTLTVFSSDEDWSKFFERMVEKIQENTKGDMKQLLLSDFSTMSDIECIVSNASIMNTVKKYFDYCMLVPGCGIRHVRFEGTEADWNNLLVKVDNLLTFVNKRMPVFESWLTNLKPIINQFVETYKGNCSVDFWDKIFDSVNGRMGSGAVEYVNGWITSFFMGIKSSNVTLSDLKLSNIEFDVNLINEDTMKNVECNVIGGFLGIECVMYDENICHRPVQGIAVFE